MFSQIFCRVACVFNCYVILYNNFHPFLKLVGFHYASTWTHLTTYWMKLKPKNVIEPKSYWFMDLNIHYSNLMNMVSCKASCACDFMTCSQWIRHLTRRFCYHVVWRKLMPCFYVILNDLLLMEGYGRNTIRFIKNHKIHDNKIGKSTLCSYSPMQLIVALINI